MNKLAKNQIAITNLGKYNEGILSFKWIELPCTEEELQETLQAIGIDGMKYEEFFISDYETEIPGMRIGEHESIEDLNELFDAYENLEEYEKEVFAAMIEGLGFFPKEALERIKSGDYDFYSGKSLKSVVYALVDEGCFGDIPDSIACYIDYDAIAHDLEIEGYCETSKGVIHVL
jgi:antirestriction protein